VRVRLADIESQKNSRHKKRHWCTIGVLSLLADFEIIPIEAVRGQIYGGMGARLRGRRPLLGGGICGSVRLGRLGIGMISKSAKKDDTVDVTQ
jgi:hypothetical protein